ncbi:MAG: ATP-binding protein [bacterium]|nr:ATP-binding protein [bacterium]
MKKYFVCLFLGLTAFSYAMEEGMETLEQVTQRMMRDYRSSSSSSARYTDPGKLDISEFECKPTEESRRIHQMALASAPKKIKAILEARQRGLLKRNWLLLHGAPGTGKSTLAEAMGCHWGKCFLVSAGIIMGDRRGLALERLNYLFRRVAQEYGKKTLVIDEINKLTDNYTSEHTDANETGTALWSNLDRFRSDLSFFLIVTANETKKLPPQLQDRFMGMKAEITGNNCDKRRIIEYYLSTFDIPRDPSIDEQFITQLAERAQNFSSRNIATLIESAVIFASLEPSKTLTPASIEEALEERKYELEHTCDFSTPVSDEERRHQESLAQQRALHEEQIRQQETFHAAQLRQQQDFHNQQVVNNAAKEAGLSWIGGRYMSMSDGKYLHQCNHDEAFRYLTEEQRELMQREVNRQREERIEKKRREEEEQRENPSALRSFFSGWGDAGTRVAGNAFGKKSTKRD